MGLSRCYTVEWKTTYLVNIPKHILDQKRDVDFTLIRVAISILSHL